MQELRLSPVRLSLSVDEQTHNLHIAVTKVSLKVYVFTFMTVALLGFCV